MVRNNIILVTTEIFRLRVCYYKLQSIIPHSCFVLSFSLLKSKWQRSRAWFASAIIGLVVTQLFMLGSVQNKKQENTAKPYEHVVLKSSEVYHDTSNTSSQDAHTEWRMKDHPHAGAIDENGDYGYVHDPTVLANSKFPFQIPLYELNEVCAPPGAGPEGIGGYRLLTEKIKVANNDNRRLKIFCSVYTDPVNEAQRIAIAETWGGHCDGYMAATLFTDASMATVHIPHMGEENYNGIWQKVRSMWSYVHDNFLESYDFFHICGDDTFVIVENLRSFLESKKVEEDAGGPGYPKPLYIGLPIMSGNNQTYFNGGGQGYTLNRAALALLVQQGFPVCRPFVHRSAEDRFVGDCFRSLGVTGYDARDALGEHRYLHEPNFVYYFRPEDQSNEFFRWWASVTRGMPPKYGLEGASNESVTFHIIKSPSKHRRIYKILYRKNFPDCSADGLDEPGRVMSEEYYNSLPHNNCTWNYRSGKHANCPFELYKEYKTNDVNNNIIEA